jgi:mannitol operon repressor
MFEDHGRVIEELQKESPRGMVLLGAAMIDDCLFKLLKGFMIDDSKEVDRLLEGGANSPLGSFSSRSLCAYCLGLISENEFHDVEIIRKIRNSFAHDLLRTSFDTQSIKDRCKMLIMPTTIPFTFELNAPSQFLITVAFLSTRIALRALSVHKQQREKARAFIHGESIKPSD